MCQGDPIGERYFSRYNGPPKSTANNQTILLDAIFMQTVQGTMCTTYSVNYSEIVSLH